MTSPSWISLIRAPASRISSIRSWWRGRSRTIVVTSLTIRPKASAIARTFSAIGARARSGRARAGRPPSCACTCPAASAATRAAPTAIIDMAPLPPRATTPRPSSGSRARSTSSPPAPTRVPTASCVRVLARRSRSRPPIGSSLERMRASPRTPPPRPPPGRRGRASARPRAPRARSRARTSRRCSAAGSASAASRLGCRSASRRPLSRSARVEHELHHAADRPLDVRVLDHRHVRRVARALDDVVLDRADVVEARRGTCRPAARPPDAASRTWKCVRCTSSSSIARTHWTTSAPSIGGGISPGTRWTPSSTIDQPSVERPLERGSHADEHVPRLLEEAEQHRSAVSSGARAAPPRSSSSGSTA